MSDEYTPNRADETAEGDETGEIFANEVTPLGVTKQDQAGPRAEREAAISGSWAPGPGSGPEGTGEDLRSYPGGPHSKGQGRTSPIFLQPGAGAPPRGHTCHGSRQAR